MLRSVQIQKRLSAVCCKDDAVTKRRVEQGCSAHPCSVAEVHRPEINNVAKTDDRSGGAHGKLEVLRRFMQAVYCTRVGITTVNFNGVQTSAR